MCKEVTAHWEAGHHVFGLHPVNGDVCGCGNPKCNALYKHPRVGKWQLTPHWGETPFNNMLKNRFFDSGYGVLCKGLLVVDIDPRNGGKRVKQWEDACNYVVETGGGGWHYYFKIEDGTPLNQHREEYKGIDFKSSGFVVGAGSLHASGNRYTIIKGSPAEIGKPPEVLLDILKKQQYYREEINGQVTDINQEQIEEVVMAIPSYDEYHDWVQVGMAIHNTMDGSAEGLALWDKWSAQSSKYSPSDIDKKWATFGKHGNPVRFGTLYRMAQECGWEDSGEFILTAEQQEIADDYALTTDHVDETKPCGFVGRVAEWIKSQGYYPREKLSAMVAIQAVAQTMGMNVDDVDYGFDTNILMFGVSGSATGKEAVLQAYQRILNECGLGWAVYGDIKSKQEIYRNIMADKRSIYIKDEVGFFMEKVMNAKKSGASYLEEVIGEIMSIYTKADGELTLGGDMKRDMHRVAKSELSRIKQELKEIGTSTDPTLKKKVQRLKERQIFITKQMKELEGGLEKPYIAFTGFTTPTNFDRIITPEQITNGFFGRAVVVKEKETNPRPNPNHCKDKSVPMWITNRVYELEDMKRVRVVTTEKGKRLMEKIKDFFWEEAESHKSSTGLEAVPRRGFELVGKLSLVLSLDTGIRDVNEILWAFAIVREDINWKTSMAVGNEAKNGKDKDAKAKALMASILTQLGKNHWESAAVLKNRTKASAGELDARLHFMLEKGIIKQQEFTHPRNKKVVVKYAIK